jgi:hypothetical protein
MLAVKHSGQSARPSVTFLDLSGCVGPSQFQTWRTAWYHVSTTFYSQYSQLPSIARLWWRGICWRIVRRDSAATSSAHLLCGDAWHSGDPSSGTGGREGSLTRKSLSVEYYSSERSPCACSGARVQQRNPPPHTHTQLSAWHLGRQMSHLPVQTKLETFKNKHNFWVFYRWINVLSFYSFQINALQWYFVFIFISTTFKFPIYLRCKFFCLSGLPFASLIRIIA